MALKAGHRWQASARRTDTTMLLAGCPVSGADRRDGAEHWILEAAVQVMPLDNVLHAGGRVWLRDGRGASSSSLAQRPSSVMQVQHLGHHWPAHRRQAGMQGRVSATSAAAAVSLLAARRLCVVHGWLTAGGVLVAVLGSAAQPLHHVPQLPHVLPRQPPRSQSKCPFLALPACLP